MKNSPFAIETFKSTGYLPKTPFPLSARFYQVRQPVKLHRHDFMELVVVSRGRGLHFTSDEEYSIKVGDVFAITGDTAHGYRDVTDLEVVNILFDPSWFFTLTIPARKSMGYHALFSLEPRFRKAYHLENKLHLQPKELRETLRQIHELIRELDTREPLFEMIVQARFLQLVGLLSRFYDRREVPPSDSLLLIGKCLSFMEIHYAKPLQIASLTQRVHFSSRTFQRTFKALVGVSPIDYLIRLRIDKSRELLFDTTRSITEIALAVGFSDSNYFSRQFKHITGMSPRDCRQSSRRQTTFPNELCHPEPE